LVDGVDIGPLLVARPGYWGCMVVGGVVGVFFGAQYVCSPGRGFVARPWWVGWCFEFYLCRFVMVYALVPWPVMRDVWGVVGC